MPNSASPQPALPGRDEYHDFVVSVFTPPNDSSTPHALHIKRTQRIHALLLSEGLDVDPAILPPGRGGGAVIPEITWLLTNVAWPVLQMFASAFIAHWLESKWKKQARWQRFDMALIDITLGSRADLKELLDVLTRQSRQIGELVKSRNFGYMIQATGSGQPNCYLSIDPGVRLSGRLVRKTLKALTAAHGRQTQFCTQAEIVRERTRFGFYVQAIRLNVPRRAHGQ